MKKIILMGLEFVFTTTTTSLTKFRTIIKLLLLKNLPKLLRRYPQGIGNNFASE